jgi:glycosyltransferase involved in cell wall biosynthesis|tara:strand:- start:9427 stop:10452 length:1026 start_codon:yes stop_codon:yes gene_type:complete
MKVLIVGSNSVHLANFVEGLNKKGIKLSLLAEEECDFWDKEYFKVSFRSLNPFSLNSNYRKLKNYLAANQFDIIHIHQANRLAYFVTKIASKLDLKVVLTAWGSDVLLMPKKNALYKFLVKKTLERSSAITADAIVMIDAMLELEPTKNKYHHLQYGIDAVQSGEKKNIIFSNRLHKTFYKIDQIISLFHEFQLENNDWKLVIAGSGAETENLKAQVNGLDLKDKVEFVGWLDKKKNQSWYSQAKIYCSIPTSDGSSVSVLESMSANCIPVLSDIPVSHEWITNGLNGIILSKNVNPFVEALSLNMEDLIKVNQELIQKKALRESCLSDFVSIYESLLVEK